MFLHSQQGVHQGDPLSGLLFTLTIHPCVHAIATIPGMVWSGWFFDDGALHEAVWQGYELAVVGFKTINISVNHSKSKLWVPSKVPAPMITIPGMMGGFSLVLILGESQ